MTHRKLLFLGFFSALCSVGCSDDAQSADDARNAGPSETDSPLYVGATRVFTADDTQGYLFAVPSLDEGTEVDLGKAVELSDAWVFGKADPFFFTATLFEPQIARWEVSRDGEFTPGPVVDFSNEGVMGTYSAAFTPVFSREKSYFIDSGSAQVVIWNPERMEFIDTIALDAPPIGEKNPIMDLTVVGDQLVVSMFWASQSSGWTEYGDFVRTIVIDTNTDEVVESKDDSRCATTAPAGVGSDGALYFGPWDYHAAVRGVFGEGFGSASCGMRMLKGASALDPAYEFDLSSLVDGRPAGGLQLLPDDVALLHVWHDDLVQATPESWTDDRFKPGYLWYRFKLGDERAEALPDQEPSSEGGEWRTLDARTVTYAPNEEYSETTLRELQEDGQQKPLLTLPGWTAQIIRAY